MSDNRDRRKSQAREDKRLTGSLINATMGYLHSDKPDTKFADVVLNGCLEGNSTDYPPQGHGYPSGKR